MPLRDFGDANVRFGPKVDIQRGLTDVRFTLKSGHGSAPILDQPGGTVAVVAADGLFEQVGHGVRLTDTP
jgi:hypothetical protein